MVIDTLLRLHLGAMLVILKQLHIRKQIDGVDINYFFFSMSASDAVEMTYWIYV